MKLLQLLPDGGPIYTETDVNATIVEPYNTLSAVLFILMSVYWYGRLKGQFSMFPYLTSSLILLSIGGVGGVIYHAFRYSAYFLYMDWLPIMVLCIMTAMYFMYKVKNSWRYAFGYFLFVFVVDRIAWELIPEHNGNLRANVNYTILGLGVLIPTLWMLYRSNYQFWYYVAFAFLSFAFALFFRISDQWGILSIGTHFLWHTFGALAGNFMLLYIHRYNLQEYKSKVL
jgi:uncharacterized membrane protein